MHDNDLDAFINIANLYNSSPIPIAFGSWLLDMIISKDRPAILDEYIRRTGKGIDVKNEQSSGHANVNRAAYLGLLVHGMKKIVLQTIILARCPLVSGCFGRRALRRQKELWSI